MQEHVAVVTLSRPDKHNAVDREMFDALYRAGTELAEDRRVRSVVLCGAGDNFCAGIDTSVFQESAGITPEMLAPSEETPANYFQRVAYVWRELPMPVIAALQGVTFGAGMQIALGADVRIARPDARLSILEIKWGLIPDMSISTTLPGLLGYDQAVLRTWTGAHLSGEEALRLGLVTEISDHPVSRAQEIAAAIAKQSPDAIRGAKALYRAAWSERDAALLRKEAEIQLAVMAAPNQREAVRANVERREPSFGDPIV